jgi:hypothetical protein
MMIITNGYHKYSEGATGHELEFRFLNEGGQWCKVSQRHRFTCNQPLRSCAHSELRQKCAIFRILGQSSKMNRSYFSISSEMLTGKVYDLYCRKRPAVLSRPFCQSTLFFVLPPCLSQVNPQTIQSFLFPFPNLFQVLSYILNAKLFKYS